ncbi:MAG: phosphate ABC transporter permease PstA [Planctomycetes bacterium]|nr:phosphate ABC transporter permease PstA [Planctomycetota bacterium]
MSLLLVAGMLLLILWKGLGFFWQKDLTLLRLNNGSAVLGEIVEREAIPDLDSPGAPPKMRVKVKQGNRDLYGADFVWVREDEIAERERPEDALAVERLGWGDFFGYLKEIRDGDKVLAGGGAEGLAKLQELLSADYELRARIAKVEKNQIGAINDAIHGAELELKKLAYYGTTMGPEVDAQKALLAEHQKTYDELVLDLTALRRKQTVSVTLTAEGGAMSGGQQKEKTLPISELVEVLQPNRMGLGAKAAHYASQLWSFVSTDPRESNTEGGVFPAIFGTVLMVLIMSIFVTPFGVLAAFYLREYAKQGRWVSVVRIAVNNLAGVPSIVFGVFGVGFFIHFVGAGIDNAFFPYMGNTPVFHSGGILWASLTLALMTVPVVIVATEEGLAAIPKSMREGSLALGATKFETTWSIVLPAVMPSILTGLILAMARAAGEVAPLMITGVVKIAPALPVSASFPFGLERQFMHLGFHIFDLGFQSPNVDAARPMVYATTLLLIVLVLVLNIGAIWIRNRLRQKYSAATAAI